MYHYAPLIIGAPYLHGVDARLLHRAHSVIFVALVRPGNIERDGVGNREGLALSRDKSPGELCVGRIISVRVARG